MVHVQVVMTGLDPTTCTHSSTWPPQGAGCRRPPCKRQAVLILCFPIASVTPSPSYLC